MTLPAPGSKEHLDVLKTQLLTSIQEYLTQEEVAQICDALAFATNAHKNQKRYSGEPYIVHPLSAVQILLPMKPDAVTIMACLLHDIPENTEHTIEEIVERFGGEVAALVSGIVAMSSIRYHNPSERELLKEFALALVTDIRIVFIKLSERLHNIQTLSFVPSEEKRKRIAEESLFIYAPIANRLGLVRLKNQLEDACFRYLEPKAYAEVTAYLERSNSLQQRLLNGAIEQITDVLKEHDVQAEVSGRLKSPYSIYSKMKRKGTSDFEDLRDLMAVRIIVSSRGTCYKVLGVMHQHWSPITSRIKDYIARPKPNNYQSIHTVVQHIFPEYPKQGLEIQIRTRKMHEEAEYGNAAYAIYKEQGKSTSTPGKWVETLKKKVFNGQEAQGLSFSDEIFVLTPEGDIIILPKGATPVDFAYKLDPLMGDTCIAAKVNGQRVALDYQLKSGEGIEIITSLEPNPNPTWLSFVVTKTAQEHIKKRLQHRDEESLLREGHLLLNEYLKKHNLPLLSQDYSILSLFVGNAQNTFEKRKEILKKISTHDLPVATVLKRLKKYYQQKRKTPELKRTPIDIDGVDNIPYKLAQCCNPKIGDQILGYTTRGNMITIHKEQCHIIKHLDPSRIVSAAFTSQ